MFWLYLNFRILGKILICHTSGSSIIFDHVQTKSELRNSMWDPCLSYMWGHQSSLTMCRPDLNFKILCKDPCLSYLWGHQSSLTMCRLNLNFKILGRDPCLSYLWGHQSSLIMCRLDLKYKILGRILVFHIRWFNHLWPCAGLIWTLKF